jgi:cobalt/nickel transport system ATP-binding protein
MSHIIRVHTLHHRYPCGRHALRGVSFAIAAGESVALVGPNGAGKTTLLLRLCGVLPGDVGQAFVQDLDCAQATNHPALPRHVGMVFQHADDQLFSATLSEDVAFGPLNLHMDDIPARVATSLAQVGLAGFEDRVPLRLSAGEKRRAALATVLAMSPTVLLLDEPTMALDPRGRREFATLLAGLPQAKLIATHDLDLVRAACTRAILLHAGTILADGPPATLLNDPALMHHFE